MATSIKRIGTLDDDLTALAARVAQQLISDPAIAWVEESVVYCGPIDDPSRAIAGDIIGSYSPGQALKDVQDDLQVLLHERSRDGLLE